MPNSQNRTAASIALMWKVMDGTGLERFELHQRPGRWILQGTILRLNEGGPIEARYSIECDSRWQTVHASIELHGETQTRRLLLEKQAGSWRADGNHLPELDGCVDIDLGWSPSTNTLPIRRLNLATGSESGPIIAAWVRFPELELQPLTQQYKRLSDREYRYSSRGGAFTADLTVDEHGLIQEYKGFWKRC